MSTNRNTPTLYIVIPCYNEQEVLPITCKEFLAKINELVGLGKITDDSRILFVNDGSKDDTWNFTEPEPGTSECSISRSDGGKRSV